LEKGNFIFHQLKGEKSGKAKSLGGNPKTFSGGKQRGREKKKGRDSSPDQMEEDGY